MGATNFTSTAFGTSMGDAFRSAREQAQYEYGHGGYSGTIAEKHGAVLFTLPKGMTARKFEGLVIDADADSAESIIELTEDLNRIKADLARGRLPRERRSQMIKERDRYIGYLRDAKRQRAKFIKAAGPHLSMIERAARVYHDKWGGAVAVKLSGAEAREARKYLRVERKRGDVYRFFGMASS